MITIFIRSERENLREREEEFNANFWLTFYGIMSIQMVVRQNVLSNVDAMLTVVQKVGRILRIYASMGELAHHHHTFQSIWPAF